MTSRVLKEAVVVPEEVTSGPFELISWLIFIFTKLSELILGNISSFIPTLRNSIEVDVTGVTLLVVNVELAIGISSVTDMLAFLLSEVTRMGFARTSAFELDANNSSFSF